MTDRHKQTTSRQIGRQTDRNDVQKMNDVYLCKGASDVCTNAKDVPCGYKKLLQVVGS